MKNNAFVIIAILLLQSSFTLANEVTPTFNQNGPEAEFKSCEEKSYPVSWKYASDSCYRVGTFTNFNQLLPSSEISNKPPIWSLTYANQDEVDLALSAKADEAIRTLPITSLIIWRNGKIQKEVYQYGRKDTDLYSSFSMHKTITGLLIDAAINQNLIASVDDKIINYLPSLSSTGWNSRSIFQALTMTSGIGQDQQNLYRPLFFKDADRLSLINDLSRNPKFSAGEKFEYSDIDTFTLGLIAEKVFNKPQGEIISNMLWQSIGAEANAQILTTKSGQHLLASNLRARPRDYLRLGLLIQNNGINHLGEQIISEQWIASLFGETEKVNTCPMYKSCNTWGVLGGGWGYSYQTWLPPIPKTMVAIGKYGQYIFVAKNSNTVIVITSADFPRGLGEKPLLMQLFRAAAES